MTTGHKMVVLAKAAPGRSEDLARWYDERHIPDLLAVPGVLSAERHAYTVIKQPAGTPEWDFLTIYELAGDDPMAVLAATAGVAIDDCLESSSTFALVAHSQGRRTTG